MANERRIYVDSCCFIDAVKQKLAVKISSEKELDVWFLKKLLQAHRDKELILYTSVITVAECSHIGEDPVPEKVRNEFDRLLMSGQYVHLVQSTPFICQDARDLRWKHGIKLRGADSIHAASALDRKCEEFLSGDTKLTRLEAQAGGLIKLGVTPLRPAKTACLPPKYLQTEAFGDSKPN